MNKAELVKAAAEKSGVPQDKVKAVLDAALDEIVGAVRGGGDVRIAEFGTFKRVALSARKGRNPATGEKFDIPARNAIKFKPVPSVAQAMG